MQFPFVGPAYVAANPRQDNQALINWYVEIDKNSDAKSPVALLGAPGLVTINTSFSGEYRGGWVLPGGIAAIAVIGNAAVMLTSASKTSVTAAQIGTLLTSSGKVGIRDNGASKVVVIVDGANLYTYNLNTGVFAHSTDPAWLGSSVVAEIDGWLVFAQPGTQKFFTTPLYWDGVAPIDGTYFALADNATDNLVTLIENKRELWLLGERHIEVWYNAGGAYFPFSRVQGVTIQTGCAAVQSVARAGDTIVFLAQSERGGGEVVMSVGYELKIISNPAISYALNQYATLSDAIGYTYVEEGHVFYVLILPTADVTWVYDFTTEMWHQRASFDTATGLFHRQRVNGVLYLGALMIAGDYQSGQIYWQTRTVYSDDANPLVSVRRCAHLWDRNNRFRIRHTRLEVEFIPGIGLLTGQGSDPQASLKWSDDGGITWGNEHFASLGQTGNSKNRCIWRQLGLARDRVYEVRVSDPVCRDVVGASLLAGETSA